MNRLALALILAGSAAAQTITVAAGTALQTIDGFGAAVAQQVQVSVGQPAQPNAVIDAFWSTAGIGLSELRSEIAPDYADCISYYGTGNCVPSSGATLTYNELAAIQRASADGASIWATLWSPPSSMIGGAYGSGGTYAGGATNNAALAAIEASYVTLLTHTYGVPIYAISVQNEPDNGGGGPSCTWTAQQVHDYIPYLTAALASAGYPGTKIMIAEPEGYDLGSYMATAMNDAAVAAQVGILASHAYTGTPSQMSLASFSNVTTQHLWETEVSRIGGAYDGSITSALTWATEIHQALTVSGVSAWHYWYAMSCPACSTDDQYLAQGGVAGFVPAMRMYMMGNWAKFVRPGWQMVSVTNSTGVLVTAFTGNGQLSIVAVNSTASAITSQAFSITGFTATRLIPWLTSSTSSLLPQNPVVVSGGSFTATLPADSITTFTSVNANPTGFTP